MNINRRICSPSKKNKLEKIKPDERDLKSFYDLEKYKQSEA